MKAAPRAPFGALRAPVIVACSGGPDSLALLVLAVNAGLDPIAVHVDHGLRGGSDREGAFVATAAVFLGCRAHLETVSVSAGPNLEARARDARYAALERDREQLNATAILTGHTADDQAETVLLNLLRGSASTGLSGMPPQRGYIIRPLLALRRAETREICAQAGLATLDDPMNSDVSFRRVWLRREVIPLLERGARRDLIPVLARQAAVLREEADFLDGLASQRWPVDGVAGIDVLASLPVPLARRAVRAWLGAAPPTQAEVEAVLELARVRGTRVELSGGRAVCRHRGVLNIERTPSWPHGELDVTLPGASSGLGIDLEAWIERSAPVRWPDGCWTCVIDADAVGDHVRLSRRPGSPRAVLATTAGEALWRVGYGVTPRACVTPRTRRYLWITATAGAS